MMGDCDGGVALWLMILPTTISWYKMAVLRLVRFLEVDLVMAFVAIGRLIEINCGAPEDQERCRNNCAEGKVLGFLAKPLTGR